MTTGKKIAVLMLAALALSGCGNTWANRKNEMPGNVGEGSDFLRKSPCVCLEMKYDGRGYEWRV